MRPIQVRRRSWAAFVAILLVLAIGGAALWDGVIPRGIGTVSGSGDQPAVVLISGKRARGPLASWSVVVRRGSRGPR